jgi:hypothetical protein
MKEIKLTAYQKESITEINQAIANLERQRQGFITTVLDALGEDVNGKSVGYDLNTGILTIKDKE